MKVKYYINAIEFASFGVRVSRSKGVLNALKMREPIKTIWPDHHGETVDLWAPRYEARELELDCFIKAYTPTAFVTAVQNFIDAFLKPGLQRLMIDVDDSNPNRKPLLYEVYLQEGIDISKKWNENKLIGTFTLKLREPEPVKRVYMYTAAPESMQVSMAINTSEPVNIFWGDGSTAFDVTNSSGNVTHIYTTVGTYYIVLTGIIEEITGITTDAALVWNKL